MKLLLLLPLILTTGCVSWTPDEYYDSPINIKDESIFTEEEIEQLAEHDDLCLGAPLGTLWCASITTAMWSAPNTI